jgi:hypothetical protein
MSPSVPERAGDSEYSRAPQLTHLFAKDTNTLLLSVLQVGFILLLRKWINPYVQRCSTQNLPFSLHHIYLFLTENATIGLLYSEQRRCVWFTA